MGNLISAAKSIAGKIAPPLFCGALLAGCATTSLEYSAPDGSGVNVQTRTLFKDINDASATWGDVQVQLGSSSGQVNPQVLACLLAPDLCQ